MTDYRALCAELVSNLQLIVSYLESDECGTSDSEELIDRARTLLDQPEAESPATQLAAHPLLEKVARMGDQASAWLEANPPGQLVAIEPRGCPTPGACSCVEPVAQPDPEGLTDGEKLQIMAEGISYGYMAGHHDTVEACYGDPDSIAADYAPEILKEMANAMDRPLTPLDQSEPAGLTQIALQMLGTIESMELIIPEITDTIRKALEQGGATPQPPSDGEVGELVEWLH